MRQYLSMIEIELVKEMIDVMGKNKVLYFMLFVQFDLIEYDEL